MNDLIEIIESGESAWKDLDTVLGSANAPEDRNINTLSSTVMVSDGKVQALTKVVLY